MNDLPINKSKVKKLIKECKNLNFYHTMLSQSFKQWGPEPIKIVFEELILETIDYLSIMSPSEIHAFVNTLPSFFQMEIDMSFEDPITATLKKRIATVYLANLVYRDYYSFKDIINNNIQSSKVLKEYPEIHQYFDKDGLIIIDDKFVIFNGGIQYKNHYLHYNQFLRRGFTGNPNCDFLYIFWNYYDKSSDINSFRISIDLSRLWPKEYYSRGIELDRWFGPKFDKSKVFDKNYVGHTIHQRISPSFFEISNKLKYTEFSWKYADGIKTLEIEELDSEEHSFDSYYINRYLHSEIDVERNIIRHLDGAVKIYLKDNYHKRLNSKIPKEEKCFKKIKLFRIDGIIDENIWLELISNFYKSNEMVLEYFDPELFEELWGNKIREYKEWKMKELI